MDGLSTDATFRFRRHDRIGATAAEQDLEFLEACFIDTGDLELLMDPEDTRVLVLGRTGSGKSALLTELHRRKNPTVIPLEPEGLALSYLSNSTIIRFFSELGVNLDPFFKLLWRHVLTVEILRHRFEEREKVRDGGGFIEYLKAKFPGSSTQDKAAREAIDYLAKWGERFWQQTEYRVKEITRNVETQLESAAAGTIGAGFVGGQGSASAASRLSNNERHELVQRGQAIISETQVQDLNKVLGLLSAALKDRQQVYYVTIDRLDENWVEERLRYRLIMALILTARDFLQVENAKVIVSLRRDLVERVFRLSRDAGFQEEKYHSLYLPLEWKKEDLSSLLDRRVNHLVRRRYTGKQVGYRDLLPLKINKARIDDYLFVRAQRPRDVITLFNTCIDASEGDPKISLQTFRRAEGEWSRSRFRALGDEWSADYPRLLDFAKILTGRAASFKLATVSLSELEEFCLQRAAEQPEGGGILQETAIQLVESALTAQDARREIFRAFYVVGLVGLKLAPHESVSWVDQFGRGVSTAQIDENTSVVTHPAFHRELGIIPAQPRPG